MENNNKKGCLMLDFEIPNWDELIKNMIDPKDIYDNDKNKFGLELKPHVTVLYGFDPDVEFNKIKKYLPKIDDKFIIEFTSITNFKNHPDYEVLKFDLKNRYLTSLNIGLRYRFPIQSDFPEYNPHCTIAYLKPGTSDKYINKQLNKPFSLIPSVYNYLSPDKENVIFNP